MCHKKHMKNWKEEVVSTDVVLKKLEPGTSIFIGTGPAEPRTLVKALMTSDIPTLNDLELIQIMSYGEATSLEEIRARRFRLKTFFSGGVASEAISAGRVDLIPSRFSDIPALIERDMIPVQAVFVQLTPPNEAGYCSLGTAVDVARLAMERADLIVGEINEQMPRTYGDTFIHLTELDLLVEGTEPTHTSPRPPIDSIIEQVAANIASVVEDGACLTFSLGPLYDAFAQKLEGKKNLGIHTPYFTDALMELVQSGAITNRRKANFRGKSLASYAVGTTELLSWLHQNPLVEMQGLDTVISPLQLGQNPHVFCALPARAVDLTGSIVMPVGLGSVATGPGEAIDLVNGAELSKGGRIAFALPSRDEDGNPNIALDVKKLPNEFALPEAVDWIITEQGVAYVRGRTVRERAQALIEVAHPDDRAELVDQAKAAKILYADQIFISEAAHFYPDEVTTAKTLKNDLTVRFRAIKPSDEEEMRRLFYRFSDEAIYYRYFAPINAMPHYKMQSYVNVDYRETLSIVGLVGAPGMGHIIAEGRFVKWPDRPLADVAFVVDEAYQGHGIATTIFDLLAHHARERGLIGFTADVLASNRAMMRVFEKGGFHVESHFDCGAYSVKITFDPNCA